MSSAGRVGSSNGCATKPRGRGTGLRSCVAQIRSSSLTGSCVMETAEQREPYESRGSRTVLGEPGGESPPGHSTKTAMAAVRLVDAEPLDKRSLSISEKAFGPDHRSVTSALNNLAW